MLSLLVPLFRDLRVPDVVEIARLAEAVGYDTLWYADERFERDPYPVLAAVAGATTTVRLGPAVTDPFSRHPAMTAVAIAALDELSGERARLGLGAGVAGFDKLHIRLDRPATAVREAIQVIRGLLGGGSVNLDGAVIRITDGRLRFRARANIEIVVAAEGPRMTEVAGSWADAVIFAHTASPAGIAWRTEMANRTNRQLPTPVRTVARLDVTVSDDGETARRMARIRAGRVLWSQYPTITYVERLGLALPAELDRRLREAGPFQRTHDLAAFERFADAIPDDLVRPIAVAGDEQEVADHFSELMEGGVDELMVHPLVVRGQELSESIDAIARSYHMARNARAVQ